MSTDYELISHLGEGVEITERSSKFDINVWSGTIEPEWCSVEGLTLNQIKEVSQRLVNVISYYDENYHECKVDY